MLPALQQRWPDLPAQVSQATEHLRESDELLREFAAADLAQCQPRDERIGVSLDMAPPLSWPRSRRNNLLRHWLAVLGYRLPARKRLEEVDALLTAGQDQNPLLNWGDCELRRYRQRIYCLPARWQTSAELTGGTITWKSQSPGLAPGSYSVVARAQAPDITRAHPSQREHSQTLKKLLQEYALEPWLREYVPLILDNDRLVAVGDLWIEKGAAVASGVVPVWSFSLPGMARV